MMPCFRSILKQPFATQGVELTSFVSVMKIIIPAGDITLEVTNAVEN